MHGHGHRFSVWALTLLLMCAAAPAQEQVDLSLVSRIKEEAFDRSKVMEHLSYLTDVYGPRLTGSPEYNQAAEWVAGRLKEYGISNVHLEKWPFGRSWSVEQYALEMTAPRYALLEAAPLAWSAGTKGPVTGALVLTPLAIGGLAIDPKKRAEQIEAYEKKWAGKLRGKIVLLTEPKTPEPESRPAFRRYTDAELADLAKAPEPVAKVHVKLAELKFPEDPREAGRFFMSLPTATIEELIETIQEQRNVLNRFFQQEGVLAVMAEDQRAHDGLTFAEGAGAYKSKDPLAPPTFVITAEQYNRIARLLEKKAPVQLRVNLAAKISDGDVEGGNIIGEIPGGAKQDEVVMIGAHFDSWHAGTGTTDNAAGSAVMIEVMRILKTLGLKMDRTVRIGLWGGEEQGFLGSRAYVQRHFADLKTMKLLPEQAKLSGYFNLDNGSGKIRGVYLQGNDAMRPLFERWLAPFRDEGVTTITIRNTSGTDHLMFDSAGLPGFQFIQDPLDYGTVTHHSNMDTYDHAVAADLMQASAVIAAVVYNAANQPALLPRKELPRPAAASSDGR